MTLNFKLSHYPAYGRIAIIIDSMDQLVHSCALVPCGKRCGALQIGVDPMEGASMPNTRFSQPCLPPSLPPIPTPPRFLVRPQRLTRAHPLP
jgi:hypothetical protein